MKWNLGLIIIFGILGIILAIVLVRALSVSNFELYDTAEYDGIKIMSKERVSCTYNKDYLDFDYCVNVGTDVSKIKGVESYNTTDDRIKTYCWEDWTDWSKAKRMGDFVAYKEIKCKDKSGVCYNLTLEHPFKDYKTCRVNVVIINDRSIFSFANNPIMNLSKEKFKIDITTELDEGDITFNFYDSYIEAETKEGQSVIRKRNLTNEPTKELKRNEGIVVQIIFPIPKNEGAYWNITYLPDNLFLDPTLNACGTLGSDDIIWTLDRSLFSTGNCLSLTGQRITINFNGFLIDGGGSSSGKGISSRTDGHKINNPIIFDFGYGISFSGDNIKVNSGTLNRTGVGIRSLGDSNNFTNLNITNNYQHGTVKTTGIIIEGDNNIYQNIKFSNNILDILFENGPTIISKNWTFYNLSSVEIVDNAYLKILKGVELIF